MTNLFLIVALLLWLSPQGGGQAGVQASQQDAVILAQAVQQFQSQQSQNSTSQNPAATSSAASPASQLAQSKDSQSKDAHDHVGKPLPDYLTGDQCLFCHRNVVGPTWQQEPHAWTIRDLGVPPETSKAPEGSTQVMGSAQHIRWLKQTGYGQFAVLADDGKTWQADVFAKRCAGCHTTGVDPATHNFSAFAFDCYACHGDVQLNHTTKPEIAWLGTKHVKAPREVVFICGQCHLRGGRSQSTDLPYPNNFIAGDDLLADFKVDLKRADDPTVNPADRHVYAYTRNVIERGSDQTCLSCHRVHGKPELKHAICIDCDDSAVPADPVAKDKAKIASSSKFRSEICQY